MFAHYLLYAARLADTLGDSGAVQAFAARMPPAREITNHAMLRAPLEALSARLSAIQGRREEACEKWARVLSQEAAIDVLGLAQETRLRYACVLLALGRKQDAANVLRPLLRTVGESGEVGGVLLAGREVLTTLAAARWRNELDWSERAALQGWALRFVGADARAAPADGLGGGLLTGRELQVLARIAAGDSNKHIARALELSPHTVKRHVANILDKLGVGSRGQAAQWYRAEEASRKLS